MVSWPGIRNLVPRHRNLVPQPDLDRLPFGEESSPRVVVQDAAALEAPTRVVRWIADGRADIVRSTGREDHRVLTDLCEVTIHG